MKTEKFNSLMVTIVAVAAVFGFVSVVWAAFSSTLTIKGSATIKSANWHVYFTNLGTPTTKGTGDWDRANAPEIDSTDDTIVKGFNAILTTPGNEVSFTVDVKNDGSFPAELAQINLPQVKSYTGTTADLNQRQDDVDNMTGKVTVTLTYLDGSALQNGDQIGIGESRTLLYTVKYDKDIAQDKLPMGDVKVEISDSQLKYQQIAAASTTTTVAGA